MDSSPDESSSEVDRVAKRVLRQAIRNRRNSLTADSRQRGSVALCSHLRDLLPRGATVMSYVAIRSEVDLHALMGLDLRLVLPRVEGDLIVAVPVEDETGAISPLIASSFGVPEPTGDPIDPQLIDVVCLPGLAFDRSGGRLGYGAGYYDRFLPLLRPDTLTIGIGFSAQVVDDVPMEAHDRRVDVVITEEGVVGGATPRN